MQKKLLTIFLALSLMLSCVIPAHARWNYISTTGCGLTINSSGQAAGNADMDALQNPVNKTKIVIQLQQYKSSKWTTIKTWQDTWNEKYIVVGGTYYVDKGYSYRIYVQYYAYNGSTQLEYFEDWYYCDYY